MIGDRHGTAGNNKSLISNVILNLIKTVSTIIFPLITFPYISRVLLPEYIGKYNFSNTFVTYFTLAASLGVSTYAIRECSMVRDDKEKVEKTASQIFSINVCSMIVSYIALAISLILFRKLDTYRTIIIILSFGIVFSIVGADWLNSAYEDFKYITIRTLLIQFASIVSMFIFVKKPEDYVNYAIISVFSIAGANILNVFYRRRFCKIRLITSFKKMEWGKHFYPIFLMFVMLLVQTIFSSSDITMIGLMRTDYEVGLYSTAVKIYSLINQIMVSILWVMLPRLTNCFSTNQYDEVNILLRKSVNFMLGLGLPCIVGAIFMSDEIVTIIGGIEYIDSSLYLKILMVALLFSLAGGGIIGNMILLPSKKEKYFLNACIVAAIANVVLNYLFIGRFGALAAAITTLISHVVILVMLVPKVDRKINIGSIKDIIMPPLVGSAVIGCICVLVNLIAAVYWIKFTIAVILSLISYLITLKLMKYELLNEMLIYFRKLVFRRKRNG